MGLSQKRPRVRFGLAECVAALLLASTALCAVLTQTPLWQAWPPAKATVVSLLLPGGEALRPENVEVQFGYTVEGRPYLAQTRLGKMDAGLMRALTPEAKTMLADAGRVNLELVSPVWRPALPAGFDLNELPAEFRALFENRHIARFEDLPEDARNALVAHGADSLEGAAALLKAYLDRGWFLAPSAVAAPSVLSANTEKQTRATPAAEPPSPGADVVRSAVPLQEAHNHGGTFDIRYNPRSPGDFRIVRYPRFETAGFLALFIFNGAASIAYCAWAYPRLRKVRRN